MGSFRLSINILHLHKNFNFTKKNIQDSRAVVIPFILVGTYPTTDYATLGPSELQPPFPDGYIRCILNIACSQSRAGQVSNPIPHLINFAEFCVFIKQSPPLVTC